ncbi:Regulatory protein AfsR [Thermoflexales bacterium]|nr:Regulatory protein AfsR [Thermoflexales bacterium]
MSVPSEASFAETLAYYVAQCGYTYGQLARLSGLPKRTIAHWLEGIVKRPRDWRDLIKLATALHLDEAAATRLLHSAQHVGVAQLLAQADNERDRLLLAPWAEIVQRRLEQSPFQALADLPYFVGRDHEIQALKQVLLGQQPIDLCSLHGMAGAGKTALAIHLAYELRPHFPAGVLWARLDNSDTMSILNSVARAYGLDVDDYKDVESRSRVVRELLARQRALIILDNVESSDQVQPLLPPSGTCAVLLTSRRHDLAIARGARRFQIGPFAQKEESFDLFARVLGSEQAQREIEPLMEIAKLLGHLPLALDIAASRIAYEPGWTAADFLDRLRREERRLSELVYENQSVRLSFNISYQAMLAEQRRFFHTLGVLGGEDFSLEAATQVAALEKEVAADQMRGLYALSLVQLSRASRYQLHPLLHDLALEGKIDDDVYERMVAFFVQYAEMHHEAYSDLDLEITNIFAALQTAFERGLDKFLIQGSEALVDYWEARGLYTQAELHLSRAVQAATSLGDARASASLLGKLGLTLIHCGQLAAGEQRLREGLNVIRQVESAESISSLLLGYLGLVAYYRSDYARMESYLQEALSLARVAHETEMICRLLEGLNETAQHRGDYAAAEAYCREGLALARQLGNREMISLLLKSLAVVLFERGGDYTEVRQYLQESLAVAQELGHHRVICLSLLSLGYIADEYGDYEQAETCLLEALRLARKVDVPVERTYILGTLGLTARGRERYAQSAEYLREGLELARRVGIAVLIAPIENAWGWLYFKQNEWDAAEKAFSEALVVSRQTGTRLQIAQALYGLANVSAAQGALCTARQRGEESLAILNEIGHRTRAEVQAWLSTL